ncbi:DUF2202 domain-containing protein [Vibrio breoganii]
MRNHKLTFIALALVTYCLLPASVDAAQHMKTVVSDFADIDSASSKSVDNNERLHLVFMREEEKLARDVYTRLGMQYKHLAIFGKVSKAEERHTYSVSNKLQHYGISDPVQSDNVGTFNGEEFGWYFDEKYQSLIDKGSNSELDALYVGAYIEELDMLDIRQCPKVIIETIDSIQDTSDCGQVYTDNVDLQRLYQSLIEGSESHLRAYVQNIEMYIGEGNYEAQVLKQKDIDTILQR